MAAVNSHKKERLRTNNREGVIRYRQIFRLKIPRGRGSVTD